MAERWEAVGIYAYKSYTKIDVWELEQEEKINSTAIHEFTHSYITKASNYGTYLIAILSVLKNHHNYINRFSGKERDDYTRNMDRLKKVFLSLNDNMKEMQEIIAYLVETLYICETNGYEEGRCYIERIGTDFKYIKSYEHIIDKEYLNDLSDIYMKYLKLKNIHKYAILQKNNSKIFLGINCIMDIGIAALNIEQFDCTDEKWSYPNAFTNSVIVSKRYNPNKRFEILSKKLLSMDCKNIDFSMLDEYEIIVSSDKIKKEILKNIIKYTNFEDKNLVKHSDKQIVNNEMFDIPVRIDTMEKFISAAYLTAIPAVLCLNSIDKFMKYKTFNNKNDGFKSDNRIIETFLKISDTICINVPPGFEADSTCNYEVRIDLDFCKNKVELLKVIDDLQLATSVKFVLKENNLFNIIDKLAIDKTIFLVGNYHLYSLINKLTEMKLKHYVFLANNMSLLFGFVRDMGSSTEKPACNAMFLDFDDIKNILIIRVGESIMFQPMINRHIESIQNEYKLIFSKDIISGKDRTIINRIIHWYYGLEADYTKNIGDNFF